MTEIERCACGNPGSVDARDGDTEVRCTPCRGEWRRVNPTNAPQQDRAERAVKVGKQSGDPFDVATSSRRLIGQRRELALYRSGTTAAQIAAGAAPTVDFRQGPTGPDQGEDPPPLVGSGQPPAGPRPAAPARIVAPARDSGPGQPGAGRNTTARASTTLPTAPTSSSAQHRSFSEEDPFP